MAVRKNMLAWMTGVGMVVFVVHNLDQPLLNVIALPNIGLILMFVPMIITLPHTTKADLGPKMVYIPLLIIVASIFVSVIINGKGLHLAWFGLALFGVYLLGRKYGREIFKPMAWAVIIGTIGMIVSAIVWPGVKTGGWISPTNYDMATGLLFFGAVVSIWHHQWILTAVAVVGLFFTGADEALFVVAVIVGVVLIRKDVGKKVLLPVVALIITLAIATPLGITQSLYFPAFQKVATAKEAIEVTPVGKALDKIIPDIVTQTLAPAAIVTREDTSVGVALNEATGKRWLDHWRLSPIRPFGYGYNVNDFYPGIPHNVPMIIVEQIGIIGALAWVWVVVYCLIKTKWKYAWMGIIALSVWDHYIWTQAAVWMPALAGVSTVSHIKRDFIYK